jgi:FlgD Ig-like domain
MSRSAVVTPWVLAFGLVAFAPAAQAQSGCYLPITGPSQICGGTADICGPEGYSEFVWTGPNGFSASTRCITVSEPGTYSLRAWDGMNGLWFGPCTHVLAGGTSGSPAPISGPSTTCSGTAARLCGPDAAGEYSWTGPNGFASAAACVDALDAGTYSLQVRASADACWSPSSDFALAVQSCRVDPGNCPQPPWFWKRECMSSRRRLGNPQLSQVASCVNDRAMLFAWSDPAQGFSRTMERYCDLRDRARRQFAAVWANVCAADLGVLPRSGAKVGLMLSTQFTLDGASMSVADWLAQTDLALMTLENRSLRDRSVKEAYKEIVRVGWSINHGVGMGPTCQKPLGAPVATVESSSMSEDELEDAQAQLEDLPLSMEMSEEPASGLRFDRVGPTPSHGPVAVSFSVASSSSEVFVGVYDITGRVVAELARGPMQAGSYNVTWDGRTKDGSMVPNGVYFVMGRVGGDRAKDRFTLLR